MKENTFSTEREIARNIILAQIASDAGKNVHLISIVGSTRAERRGYEVKDIYIEKAIRLLDNTKSGVFKYFIEKAPDQKENLSILVYFTAKIEKFSFQVSFHIPYKKTSKFLRAKARRNHKTHWNWEDSNKSRWTDSRTACRVMASYFNLLTPKQVEDLESLKTQLDRYITRRDRYDLQVITWLNWLTTGKKEVTVFP